MKVVLIRTNKLLPNFSSKNLSNKNGKSKIIKVDKFKFKFKINGKFFENPQENYERLGNENEFGCLNFEGFVRF